MENHEWQILRTCFIQILEDTAFMFADVILPEEGEEGESAEEVQEEETTASLEEVEISFSGPAAGSLAIVCDESFMTSLAANVLGLDETEISCGDDKIDALKELLNIICGNFLTSLGGSREVYDLTIPQVGIISSIELLKEKMQNVGLFDVDGNTVALALRLDARVE